MRVKYIVVGILLLGGVLGGTWNWMRYFKQSAPAVASQIEALRPPSRVEQQFKAENPAPGAPTESAKPVADTSAPKLDVPESLGRNPFITLEEQQALDRGVIPETNPQSAISQVEVNANLPPVQVQGLIQDNVTGRYRVIIDGRNYSPGDMLGQERIAEITTEAVVLEFEGQTRRIPVRSTEESTPEGMRIIRKHP